MHRVPSLLLASALSAAISFAAGCGSPEPEPAAPIARVNGQPIAVQAPTSTNIEHAIARHLAAEEALRRGLAKNPTAEPSVKDEERLRDDLFASMRDSLVLSEDELRAHYEKTKLRYAIRQLVLRRRAFPSEAEARAEERRLGAAGRIDVANAETIGPAPIESLPGSVLPEALSLTSPGQRVAVQRDGRWFLVELEEIRPAEPLRFEAARPKVEQSLRLLRAQAEFHAEIERLRREAKIEIAE